MKIALLGPSHPFRGGIVHFNSRLAATLQSRSDLTVDLFYWSKPYPEFLQPGHSRDFLDEASSLTFHRQGLPILSYTNPLSWARLIQHLRRGRYDMLITHWVHPVHFPVFKVLFTAVKLLTRMKICVIVHNSLPHERFPGDKIMTRSVLNIAHRLIMHGQAEVDLARHIGFDHQKTIKAFHPVYDQFITPSESSDNIRMRLGLRKRVLLFFGFIRPYKGLDVLLAAFRSVAREDPDTSLLIVGESFLAHEGVEGTKDRFLQNLPKDDPVRSQIVWIDRYVPNEEVGSYFAVADVFVAPYLSVTQSGPLTIAYAFDKPIIASNLPAFRESVGVGESGYLFETGNTEDLAKTIKMFFKTPVRDEKVKRFRQRLGWDRYVDLLLEVTRSESSPSHERP